MEKSSVKPPESPPFVVCGAPGRSRWARDAEIWTGASFMASQFLTRQIVEPQLMGNQQTITYTVYYTVVFTDNVVHGSPNRKWTGYIIPSSRGDWFFTGPRATQIGKGNQHHILHEWWVKQCKHKKIPGHILFNTASLLQFYRHVLFFKHMNHDDMIKHDMYIDSLH